MEKTDPDLIERARSGDRDAFSKLVTLHQKRVYATAGRMVGSHDHAEDIAQEAFLRAYRGLKGFDGRADFFTWLYRIVVNVALNHIRAHAGKKTSAEVAASTDPTSRLEARDRAR